MFWLVWSLCVGGVSQWAAEGGAEALEPELHRREQPRHHQDRDGAPGSGIQYNRPQIYIFIYIYICIFKNTYFTHNSLRILREIM